ncbi:hypothetical protein SEPCBS57363_002914 [Sporothrix epigloea]|uniref:Homeobox domain-containing protein n=1 Tax=Sporothrix epigloea TaxID=1892477 RepID=A0ABP0DJU2_9PEZI
MDYPTVMHSIPQMGMLIGAVPRPDDISRPRHAYPYSYGGEPFYLFSQMPAHHRSMTEAQLAIATKQMDPKPRLGKDEVQMLEDEFQKNSKPSTMRKREIADILKVDNPRINVSTSIDVSPIAPQTAIADIVVRDQNWFQNRRAKAKQMSRQAGKPTHDNLSPSASSPSEQLDDSVIVNEYFDSQNQSLPLRASSATFPVADQPSLTIVYPPHDEVSVDFKHSTSPSDPSTEGYPSPASLVYPLTTSASDELPFQAVLNGAYISTPCNTTSYSSHASPQQAPSMSDELGSEAEFDPSLDAYAPFTATSVALGAEHVMPQNGSFQSELLSMDNISQLDKETQSLSAFEVSAFDETLSLSKSSSGSPHSSVSDLRFKSPPPPANIASRRNKGAPAMLNATALRSQSFGPKTSVELGGKRADGAPTQAIRRIASATGLISNRVQKPGVPAAPRSPLYYERTKEALLQSLHTATSAGGGGPPVRSLSHSGLPVSPNEALTPNGTAMVSSSFSDDERYLSYGNSAPATIATAGHHNPYFGTGSSMLKTPPSTPGFHGLAQSGNEYNQHTQWSFVPQDEALLTPSLGSFGSEEFTMLQTAPSYIATSQPPTPVYQSLGHGYFPMGLQGVGGCGVTGVPAAPGLSDYPFPGEGYIFTGSYGNTSPCHSKSKMFQFTQNVTPQDYNAER